MTAVSIHAIQGVLNVTNSILVINTMVHVILTVRTIFGALNVINNAERVAVKMLAIECRVIASASALKLTSEKCVMTNAAKIVTLQWDDLVTKLTDIV